MEEEGKGIHVLLVDDHDLVLQGLGIMLCAMVSFLR